MHAIHTDGLTKRYRTTRALAGVDLRVDAGEVFGLIGPNGAGKSTTIGILLGYRSPTAGSVSVRGRSPVDDPVAVRERVGAMPERAGLLPRLAGRRHLAFLVRARGVSARPRTLLRRVGLSAEEADRDVRTYSTGMVKRLQLAMALVGRPDVLVLDEPAAGLDPAGIERFRELIAAERDRGAAVLFSSHHLGDVAAVCDRVGFLVDGALREVIDDVEDEEALAARFRRRTGATDGR